MRKITAYRKAYLKFQVSEARRKLKAQAVEYKGGKCQSCGYDKCLSVLAFHHLDPNEKDFAISGNYKSFRHIKPELDKTILLCSNCHGELHDKLHKEHIETRRIDLANRAPRKTISTKPPLNIKITNWPEPEILNQLVWESPMISVAKNIGVSDSALKHHCTKAGITTPGRGYWLRKDKRIAK